MRRPLLFWAYCILIGVLGALVVFGLAPASTFARPYVPPPFHLVDETFGYNVNTYYPPCLNEDDSQDSYWTGYLSGASTYTVDLCEYGVDFYELYGTQHSVGAGNVALAIQVVSVDWADVKITDPNGVIYTGELLSATTYTTGKNKGHTEYRQKVCVTHDNFHELQGGVWTYTITGTFSDSYYYTYATGNAILDAMGLCPYPY